MKGVWQRDGEQDWSYARRCVALGESIEIDLQVFRPVGARLL